MIAIGGRVECLAGEWVRLELLVVIHSKKMRKLLARLFYHEIKRMILVWV